MVANGIPDRIEFQGASMLKGDMQKLLVIAFRDSISMGNESYKWCASWALTTTHCTWWWPQVFAAIGFGLNLKPAKHLFALLTGTRFAGLKV